MRILLTVMILAVISVGCSSDSNEPIPPPNNNNGSNDTGGDTGNGNPAAQGFTPCQNGMAGAFPCDQVDLMAWIPLNEFNASAANDIWGWTDPTTGKEYAIIGLDNGTAFVDITDTENLVYLGKLPTATSASAWRDIKVYMDHVYVVSEAGGHGMQVMDLSVLRNVLNPPVTFSEDTRFTGFGNAHNLAINEASGYAFGLGTSRGDAYNGGAHFVNINNPGNPTASGGYGDDGYSHDAQIVNYNGPDPDHTGIELYIGANESFVTLVDISDKNNPVQISTINYSNTGYTHQGWLTEDHNYLILGDETDEINFGFNSRTLVFDLTDLDNPLLHTTYTGPTTAIDHNGYVKGNTLYLANYTAGVRILDISGISSGAILEVASFDTFPSGNSPSFNGVWSVYPYFDSGNIVVSDMSSGLFILREAINAAP